MLEELETYEYGERSGVVKNRPATGGTAWRGPSRRRPGRMGRRRLVVSGRVLQGRCGCGAVHYEVADEFRCSANCHCSRCRAATRWAFKAFAGIERDKLAVTEGDDLLMVFGEDDLNDTRCAECGSLLYSVVREGGLGARGDGLAGGRPDDPPERPHLRRLEGAVVRDHGRPPADKEEL